MLNKARLSFPFLLVLVYSATAAAASSAQDLLMKMNQAARSLNYEGIFVYGHGDQLEAMRIIHMYENGLVRERLLSLNGVAREIIRDDKEVRCYLPDRKSVVVEHRKAVDKNFPPVLTENIGTLDRNYILKIGGAGRVADRQTHSVIIKPRDRYRYGYQLWADDETGLLLKADLLDSENKPIERFMFTQVNIDIKIDPSQVVAHTPIDGMVWHRENGSPVAELMSGQVWQAAHLPRGFKLSTRLLRKVPTRKVSVEHLVYTDGLAAVSIFIEALEDNTAPVIRGPSRMGAVNAYGSVVDNHQITVVGEVPAVTVALIGNSVTLK